MTHYHCKQDQIARNLFFSPKHFGKGQGRGGLSGPDMGD